MAYFYDDGKDRLHPDNVDSVNTQNYEAAWRDAERRTAGEKSRLYRNAPKRRNRERSSIFERIASLGKITLFVVVAYALIRENFTGAQLGKAGAMGVLLIILCIAGWRVTNSKLNRFTRLALALALVFFFAVPLFLFVVASYFGA